MRIDEAIRILTLERDDWETSHCTPYDRKCAFEMAINALEKEAWKEEHPVSPLQPCKQDDLISRAAAQTETHEKRTETHSCDCIERQAAIDAIDKAFERSNPLNCYIRAFMVNAISEVRKLPSAQPEVIRRKECKHWNDIDDGRQKHRMCADIYGEWYCADAERKIDE